MKTVRFWVIAGLLVLIVGSITVFGQDYRAEVPGDNFSLEGALELFKQSESPEDFERLLNSQESKVNNLDLNGDGYIDYIRVFDRNEGNVHLFVLQAVISEHESQDIAVIELEKQSDGKAVLQIIGDEDIYGIETIIEPTREVRVNAGTSTSRVVVNVWTWPAVRYVYSPYYTVYASPWHWHRHPSWWHAWHPVTYHEYYTWSYGYRPYYTVCTTYRIGYIRTYYRPYRTTSVIVINKHRDHVTRYRANHKQYDRYRYDHPGDRYGRTTPDNRYDRYSNDNRSEQRDGNRTRTPSQSEYRKPSQDAESPSMRGNDYRRREAGVFAVDNKPSSEPPQRRTYTKPTNTEPAPRPAPDRTYTPPQRSSSPDFRSTSGQNRQADRPSAPATRYTPPARSSSSGSREGSFNRQERQPSPRMAPQQHTKSSGGSGQSEPKRRGR